MDAPRTDPHEDIWRSEWRERLRDEALALQGALREAEPARRSDVLRTIAERLKAHAGQAGFFDDAATQALCREAARTLEAVSSEGGESAATLAEETLRRLSGDAPATPDADGLDAFLAELRACREPAPAEDRLFHLAAVARALIDGWAARGEVWPETLAAAAGELSRASAEVFAGATAEPRPLGSGPETSEPQAETPSAVDGAARGHSGTVNPHLAFDTPLPSDGKRAGGEGVAALAEDLETLRDLMRDEGVPGRVTARFDALLRKLYRARPRVANNNDAMESVSAIGVRVGERRFAVETRQWVGVHADHGDAASRDADRAALRVRGADYEIVRAQRWSDADGTFADRARPRGVYALLRDGGRAWALEVDEVLGELRLKHTRPVPSPEFPSWPRVGMDRLDEEWPILDAALVVSPAFDNPPVVEDAEPEAEGRPSLAPLLRALSPRGRRGGDPGT